MRNKIIVCLKYSIVSSFPGVLKFIAYNFAKVEEVNKQKEQTENEFGDTKVQTSSEIDLRVANYKSRSLMKRSNTNLSR